MSIQSDIQAMEFALIEADRAGNKEEAVELVSLIDNAKTQLASEMLKQAKSPGESAKSAAQAGFTRLGQEVKGAGQEFANIAQRSLGGVLGTPNKAREDIVAEQRAGEQAFHEATQGPRQRLIGEAARTVTLGLAGAGSSLAGSLLRGGESGSIPFQENVEDRAVNAALGGTLAAGLGRGLGGRIDAGLGRNTLGARAQRLGMATAPESRGPVIGRESIERGAFFSASAEKVSDLNQDIITKEAMRMLGQKGNRIQSDTFKKANDQYQRLLGEALADKSIIPMTGFSRRLGRQLARKEGEIFRDKDTITALEGFVDDLNRPNMKDFISGKEYKEFRTQLGRMAETDDPAKKIALRSLIDDLDDAAQVGLNPKANKKFKDARQMWRNIQLFKSPNVISNDSKKVVPNNLWNSLQRNDENRFLYQRGEQPDLYEMLRLDFDLPMGPRGSRPGVSARATPSGLGFILSNPQAIAEAPFVGAARIPNTLLEGQPAAIGARLNQLNPILGGE